MRIRKTRAAASGLLWVVSCVLCASTVRAQTTPNETVPAPAPASSEAAPAPPSDAPATAPAAAPVSGTSPATAPAPVSGASPATAPAPATTPAPTAPALDSRAAPSAREAVIALSVAPQLVDAAALRSALEAELGVGVVDAAYATAGMPTLRVSWVSTVNIEVSLTSRSLPRASREVALIAQRPEERVQIVAFIAANLVRNEAASLLPDLRPIDPSAPSSAPVVAKPPLVSPCALRGEAAFGIDLIPGVGASSTRSGREATRRLSLGLGGTLSSRLHGLEFSFGASIQRVSVCGAQLAIGASMTYGPVQGVQGAIFSTAKGFVGAQGGVVAVNVGDFDGVQGGVVSLNTGTFDGVQGGVVSVSTDSFDGLQAGVASYTGGDMDGLQGGVANLTLGSFDGLQGGVANLTLGDFDGLQAGVANTTAGQLVGAQLGVANYAGSLDRGAQLGVVNISGGRTRGTQVGVSNVSAGAVGTQVGVVNYADSSAASIGIISIHRRGRTSIDTLASVETGALTVGVTHGGKYVHNSYGVGPRFGTGNDHGVAVFALGVRVLNLPRVRIDIDAFNTTYLSKDMGYDTSMAGLRVPVTVMLVRGFGVVAAPTYQVMVTDNPNPREQSIFGDTLIHRGKDVTVLGFAGLVLGLRYEFDHGLTPDQGR